MKKVILIVMATALVWQGCGVDDELDEDKLLEDAKVFGALPDTMPGSENDTEILINLGKKLYNEKKLSINDTQSCNSCHMLDAGMAGVDNEPVSDGAEEGKFGTRNSPTVLNAGFHIAQFWDGRAADLKEQAKGPILNPVEMAMPSEEAVIEKLSKDVDYKTAFAAAFPGQNEAMTYDNLAHAVAAFERTLVSKSRFDDYVIGDKSALSMDEKQGLRTFIDVGCGACHTKALFGGHSYQKMGVHEAYANQDDLGRFDVTKEEADKYVFKVMPLRNIALTGPYFHDGAVAKLEDAVDLIAKINLAKTLEKSDIDSIVTFLHALSDKELEEISY